MRQWWKAIVPVMLVFAVAGCSDAARTRSELAASEETVRKDGAIYFIDGTDAGDDPFTAGCHWKFTDPACTQNRQFHSGDFCSGEKNLNLYEWTSQVCHPPQGDMKFYDCDAECKRLRKAPGHCESVAKACGADASARCVCENVTGLK
jgi:hypothetical protein